MRGILGEVRERERDREKDMDKTAWAHEYREDKKKTRRKISIKLVSALCPNREGGGPTHGSQLSGIHLDVLDVSLDLCPELL
jgi:hypothetical protein